jgi:hypothetical protein
MADRTPLENEALQTTGSVDEEIKRVRARRGYSAEQIEARKQSLELERSPEVQQTVPPVNEEDEDDGFFDNLSEIALTAGEEFIEQLGDFAADAGNALETYTDLGSPRLAFGTDIPENRGLPIPFTKARVSYFTADEWKQYSKEYEVRTGESAELLEFDIPDFDRPDSALGLATADFTRFVAGYLLVKRVAPMKGLKEAGTASRIAANALEAGIAATVIGKPMEDNIVNMLNEHFPKYTPDFLSFLESKEDEEVELLNRLRTGLADAGLGVVLDQVIEGFKWAKNARKLSKEAKVRADDVAAGDVTLDVPEAPVAAADEVAPAADEAIPVPDEAVAREAPAVVQKGELPEIQPEPRPGQATRDHHAEVESLTERIKTAVKDPDLAQQIVTRITKGGVRDANQGIDFNFNTRDWEAIAAATAENPAALRTLINDISEIFQPVIEEAAGGVQRLDVTEQLARSMDDSVGNVEKLFADLTDGPGLAARMMAAQQMLQASAANVIRLSRVAAKGGDREIIAGQQAVELHGMLQAMITGSKKEIARALHSMRRVGAAAKSVDADLEEAVLRLTGGNESLRRRYFEQLGNERSLRAVNRAVRKSRFQRIQDMALELYINGLLSAPSTQLLNIISNGIKVIEEPIARVLSVGVGATRNGIRRAVGLTPVERMTMREVTSSTFGALKGVQIALRVPLAEIARNITKVGYKRALRDALEDPELGTVYRTLIDEQPTTDILQRVDIDTRRSIPGFLGAVARLPGRGIMTSDEFFKSIAYNQELYGRAYRGAARLADEKALVGARREGFMKAEIQKLINDPPDDLDMAAIDHARYQTFQSAVESAVAKNMERALAQTPFLRFIMPFYRTPVNIVKQAVLDRSPLGLLSGKVRNRILKGGHDGDIAMSRLILGMGAVYTAVEMYEAGRLTGANRIDPKRSNTKELSGIPPYAVEILGKWVQYNRLDPFGMLLGLTVDLMDGLAAMQADPPDNIGEQAAEAFFMVTVAVSENITSKTWFKGLNDIFNLATDPKRYAQQVIPNLGNAILTPYSSLLRRINVDHDEFARLTWSWADKWRNNIPGLSDDLPIRRDYLGNPVERQDYLGGAWLSPIAVGAEKNDPVYKELARLAFDYDMPNKDLYAVGFDIEPEQFARFMELSGPDNPFPLQEQLASLMKSGGYKQALSDEGREKLIKDVVSSYRTAAKAQLLIEEPELLEKVQEARREQKLAIIQPSLQ